MLKISEHSNPAGIALHLAGTLDATTSPVFETRLMGLIASGHFHVVINMQDVDYISSTGLRVFLKAIRAVRNQQGEMVLCSLQEQVQNTFRLAGFLSFFTTAASTEAAWDIIHSKS